MPKVLVAGEEAGKLSESGAYLIDLRKFETRNPGLSARRGCRNRYGRYEQCSQRTGNISAGTSAFAMIVLEKELENVHPEIDMVTTPSGELVGMVHTNNCSSDINAWVSILKNLPILWVWR